MNQVINFNSSQVITVKGENIRGILIDIKALESDGSTVASINDLNQIPLVVKVYRDGVTVGKEVFNNYLDYILRTIHAGTTGYGVAIAERTEGYLIRLDFRGAIELEEGDYLTIECKAPVTAFTSLSTNISELNFETIPAKYSSANVVQTVDAVNYGNGADTFNDVLGNGITKVVLVHDLGADYLASTEAKPTTGIDLVANGYSSKASENLLLSDNLQELAENPETAIKDLVIYNSDQPLYNTTFTVKYNKPVLTSARIMLLKKERV